MSFVVLHADRLSTVLADDPIVPAGEVGRVRDALALFADGERALAAANDRAEAAGEQGRADGYRDGYAEGQARAAEALAAELADMTARERARRHDIGRLALEVVRRMIGEIGEAEAAARLAERAVAAAMPEGAARVRVHPDALAATEARLARDGVAGGVAVEADASLDPTACVVETPVGRVHAGLELQLAEIARAWGEADAGR